MTSNSNDLEARALTLAEQALGKPASTAEQFILTRTEDNSPLRARALQLLSAAQSDDEHSVLTGGGAQMLSDMAEPDRIGNYAIEREIGRGGMGVVYLGRRTDTDFDHEAAIKVVTAGTRTPKLSERLRSERRLLARLKHPHIAQFYDGDETEDGRPYFIMEYVKGDQLHKHLTENAFTLGQRLTIFTEICSAVAYAHRNLVIHRDLSLANILVSEDGTAKVIDFGISHSFVEHEDGGEDNSLMRMTMTKGYTAPERVRGNPATTLSDIYSLGIVFEKLTNQIDAPRKSDLTAIAKKARAELPEERYQSVEEILIDLRDYNEGKAVAAANDGWRYEAARFIGRRKLAVGAGAFAALCAIAASIIFAGLFVRAQTARHQAEVATLEAEQRFGEVRELASFLLYDVNARLINLDGAAELSRDVLTKSNQFLDTLAQTENAPLDVRTQAAEGYAHLAKIYSGESVVNLGDPESAARNYDKSISLFDSLYTENKEDLTVIRAYSAALSSQAIYYFIALEDSERAIQATKKGRELLRSISPQDENYQISDTINLIRLARIEAESYAWLENPEEGISILADAVQVLDLGIEKDPNNLDLLNAKANVLSSIGSIKSFFEEDSEKWIASGIDDITDAIVLRRQLLSIEPTNVTYKFNLIHALERQAQNYALLGDHQNALSGYSQAKDLAQDQVRTDPANYEAQRSLLAAMSGRAEHLVETGEHDEAVAEIDAAFERRQEQHLQHPENPGRMFDLLTTLEARTRIYKKTDHPKLCTAFQEYKSLYKKREQLGYNGDFEISNFDEIQNDIDSQCP